jgi:hypothetical protein
MAASSPGMVKGQPHKPWFPGDPLPDAYQTPPRGGGGRGRGRGRGRGTTRQTPAGRIASPIGNVSPAMTVMSGVGSPAAAKYSPSTPGSVSRMGAPTPTPTPVAVNDLFGGCDLRRHGGGMGAYAPLTGAAVRGALPGVRPVRAAKSAASAGRPQSVSSPGPQNSPWDGVVDRIVERSSMLVPCGGEVDVSGEPVFPPSRPFVERQLLPTLRRKLRDSLDRQNFLDSYETAAALGSCLIGADPTKALGYLNIARQLAEEMWSAISQFLETERKKKKNSHTCTQTQTPSALTAATPSFCRRSCRGSRPMHL